MSHRNFAGNSAPVGITGIEPAYSYADLESLGEGSRWTIDRGVRDGTYPCPDFRVGRHPRWLASTVQAHRETLIAARRSATDAAAA